MRYLASAAILLMLGSACLHAQQTDALLARIRSAPLAPERRDAVEAAYLRKDVAGVEKLLGNASDADVQALLGALEFSAERMVPAIQAFQKADKLKPLDDKDRFTVAMALINLGEAKNARTLLASLQSAHPDQPIYLYWLGRLDYYERLYSDAVEKFQRVIAMDPESVRAYDNLGLSYDMMGESAEAEKAFLRATALNRKLPQPSAWPPDNLGYLLLRQQKFSAAEESLREALKYDAKSASAHFHLGRTLEGLHRDDDALAEYRAAADLDPKLAEPLYSMSLLYRRTGRTAEAEKTLAEYKHRKQSP